MKQSSVKSGFLVLALTACGVAQPVPAKHSSVELISREGAAGPGANLLLGVQFVLEPGWHIYWINPGDSGQPPAFKWQLPAGFSAGEIQWPRPERMQSSPESADYGYHDQALLVAAIRVPQQWTGHSAEIAVEAKWLICREICIPDHAQLHLSLPAARKTGSNAEHADLFAATLKLVPKPLPPAWSAAAISRKEDFVLSVRTSEPAAKAEFFPLAAAQVDNAAPQRVTTGPRSLNIVLKKSEYLVKPIATLRGVLVFGGTAYNIEAPVRAGKE